MWPGNNNIESVKTLNSYVLCAKPGRQKVRIMLKHSKGLVRCQVFGVWTLTNAFLPSILRSHDLQNLSNPLHVLPHLLGWIHFSYSHQSSPSPLYHRRRWRWRPSLRNFEQVIGLLFDIIYERCYPVIEAYSSWEMFSQQWGLESQGSRNWRQLRL